MGFETVTIGGREFRVGATYAPKRPGLARKPRRLQGLSSDERCRRSGMNRPGGTVYYATKYRNGDWWSATCSAVQWLRWAGEEVAQP